MPIEIILPLSMVMGLVSWALIVRWYVHPVLSRYPFRHGVQPILLLHSFRYIGLMFLVPGVTSSALDSQFADNAAYGDLVAALLAFVALVAIRGNSGWGLTAVTIFNLWGLVDLVNAVGRGLMFVPNTEFGATFWIPATIVPLLLVTHIYVFFLILREVDTLKFTETMNA